MPDAPNLAGQNERYLVQALKDYRGGQRKHESMSLLAKTLSDKEIADLAAFYSRLPAGGKASGAAGASEAPASSDADGLPGRGGALPRSR